jgi:ElaA protein
MSENSYQWTCKTFQELSVEELYSILRLRSDVFVVEQNCVFLDLDNKDQYCYHIMGWDGKNLVASTRLVPKGVSYPDYHSIGRVVNSKDYRGLGLGKELMEYSIQKCIEHFGNGPIKIGAQLYLKKFYASQGFEQISEVYDEDGIDHIEMIRQPT